MATKKATPKEQELVNVKVAKMKEFLEASKIECFDIEERKDEMATTIFRSRMQVKGQVLPFAILIDNSVYLQLQVQLVAGAVKDQVFTNMFPILNNLNNNIRMFKFSVTPQGDLLLNVCLTAANDEFNPALLNAILGETLKFLEAQYAAIMEHVWKESK